jgi:DNA-binding beta-propeller fold protein YncE
MCITSTRPTVPASEPDSDVPLRIYVPNTGSKYVDVIVIPCRSRSSVTSGWAASQHITPSYDLRRLWVLNDLGDSLTEIDPATGKNGKTIRVKDPYNMYYTPDGRFAVVVAEREAKLNFLNASDMKLVESVPVPCRGVDHMDFAANGRFLIASCEFAATLVKVDVATRRPLAARWRSTGGMPQDVRIVTGRLALLRRGHDGERRTSSTRIRSAAWNSSRRAKARTASP